MKDNPGTYQEVMAKLIEKHWPHREDPLEGGLLRARAMKQWMKNNLMSQQL